MIAIKFNYRLGTHDNTLKLKLYKNIIELENLRRQGFTNITTIETIPTRTMKGEGEVGLALTTELENSGGQPWI